MLKKVVVSSILLASIVNISSVNADEVKEVACSTDSVFSEYSCNQCFDGGEKWQGSTVWSLADLWKNTTGVNQILYKELQLMPEMKSLNGASWSEDKVQDSFWKFTDSLEGLFDKDASGYVLKAWDSVNWIESTEGSSYVLDKNSTERGTNIGLLVYSLSLSNILENWEVSTDQETHKECVLYKSGSTPIIPKNEKPKELPKTGPAQFFLLLLLAMFLAFWILRFKKS